MRKFSSMPVSRMKKIDFPSREKTASSARSGPCVMAIGAASGLATSAR